MIITVDGFDGSGKSTLARELSKRLNFKYIDKPIHQLFNVCGDDNELSEVIYQIQDRVYNKTNSDRLKVWFTGTSLLYVKEVLGKQNLIIDRGILSCYAFNGNATSDKVFDQLLEFGVWFDICVFLYVSPEVRRQRLLKRNSKDPDLTLDKISALRYEPIEAFIKLHKNLPMIIINTDNLSQNQIVEEVIRCLKDKDLI